MKSTNNEFKNKFKIEKLSIKKFQYWTISLRPKQVTLGSLIVSLNKECDKLSKITSEEASELSNIFNFIEKTLESLYKPDKINYLTLMMVDDQVHMHVIPRYSKVINRYNINFSDKDWPKPPNVLESLELKEPLINQILNDFKD